MHRLKVVHIITGLYVGGAETMLYKLLSEMDHDRFQNVVVSLLEIGPIGKQIQALGIPVYSLGMKRGLVTPGQFAALWRVLHRERPSIVQTWLYHADLLGLLAGRLARVPHIVWNLRCADILGYTSANTSWVLRACALLSRWPDAIISNSHAGKAIHASAGYRARRWVVIPNGFDLARFKPDSEARASVRRELGICPEDAVIGTVARFDPAKDYTTFLRAALRLLDSNQHVSFVLVGRGVVPSNPHLQEILGSNEAHHRTHMLGVRTDVPRLLAALDIFTCSSASEGFANVIGEAMACGVPCVVTDVGDSARIVGDTGRVVAPRDPGALAAAWESLLRAGPQARQQLGARARQRVEQHYSLEAVTRMYEELYLSWSEE